MNLKRKKDVKKKGNLRNQIKSCFIFFHENKRITQKWEVEE